LTSHKNEQNFEANFGRAKARLSLPKGALGDIVNLRKKERGETDGFRKRSTKF
jgi:hypothetical protein